MNAFGYRPGSGLLHRFDPRFKLTGLVLTGLVGLTAPLALLAAFGALVAAALRSAGIGPLQWVRDLRIFWLLLLFVFFARALGTDGAVLVRIAGVSLTVEGIFEGAAVCLRLLVVTLAGIGVSASTSPSEIEAAVLALLRPVPLLPEKRVATMLGLLVRFLPEVLHQARQVREAQASRCAHRCKNPLRRLSLPVVPLLRRILLRADSLALAMEARCYSDGRTGPSFSAKTRDGLLIGLLASLVLISFLC